MIGKTTTESTKSTKFTTHTHSLKNERKTEPNFSAFVTVLKCDTTLILKTKSGSLRVKMYPYMAEVFI